jgi:hypothetical protein
VAGVKEILLAKVTKLSTYVACDGKVIVDDQGSIGALCDRQDRVRHAMNFIGRRSLGAELDDVRAPIAQLLSHEFRRATVQVGRVHEGVESAVGERFH